MPKPYRISFTKRKDKKHVTNVQHFPTKIHKSLKKPQKAPVKSYKSDRSDMSDMSDLSGQPGQSGSDGGQSANRWAERRFRAATLSEARTTMAML